MAFYYGKKNFSNYFQSNLQCAYSKHVPVNWANKVPCPTGSSEILSSIDPRKIRAECGRREWKCDDITRKSINWFVLKQIKQTNRGSDTSSLLLRATLSSRSFRPHFPLFLSSYQPSSHQISSDSPSHPLFSSVLSFRSSHSSPYQIHPSPLSHDLLHYFTYSFLISSTLSLPFLYLPVGSER